MKKGQKMLEESMKNLIIGKGEVGLALNKILPNSICLDRSGDLSGEVEVMHIAFPYSSNFKKYVKAYQKKYNPRLTIVHSSTVVGTCDALGVVHSPIRGVHPHLEEGIRTFVKYFGGKKAEEAALIFYYLGIRTKTFPNAKTTEALKLWDTTQYGRLIMLEKEIYEWCKKNKVDFKAVYTEANQTYNEGYEKLGRPEVVRPWLKHKQGPIGGHCVIPNAKLLKVEL